MPLDKTALATHPLVRSSLVLGALGCAIGAGLMLAPEPRVAMPPLPVVPPQPLVKLDRLVGVPPIAGIAATNPRAKELELAFTLDRTTYVRLATLPDLAFPKHAAWKLHVDQGIYAAIAPVAAADLPSGLAVWADRTVTVDNRCTAKIRSFAIVSWLTGEPAYAGLGDAEWHVGSIVDHGAAMIVAKLDGCGDRPVQYARDAALPGVVALERITDKRLAARAKARLIASHAAAATQSEWLESNPDTRWETDKNTAFDIQVLRHPTTGVTWVSVHAGAEYGCGMPDVNVWGLYRVDERGELVAVHEQRLGEITTIDALLDIDGDGAPELLGHEWLGNSIVVGSDGTLTDTLEVPFFGCPC